MIRRRKRTSEVEPESAPAEPLAALEPVPSPEPMTEPALAPEPEPSLETGPAAESEVPVRPAAPAGPEESREVGTVRPRPAPREESAAERAGHTLKQFKEVVYLREQEQLARQVTGRTGPRPTMIDPRVYASPRRKRRDALPVRRPAAAAAPKAGKRVVRADGSISVAELARQLGVKAPQVQGKLMALGTMVSIQQTIDVETASRVAKEFGFEVQDVGFQEQSFLDVPASAEPDAGLVPRPVVVRSIRSERSGQVRSFLNAVLSSLPNMV